MNLSAENYVQTIMSEGPLIATQMWIKHSLFDPAYNLVVVLFMITLSFALGFGTYYLLYGVKHAHERNDNDRNVYRDIGSLPRYLTSKYVLSNTNERWK